jgi:very-short-patch-repair endonuclease
MRGCQIRRDGWQHAESQKGAIRDAFFRSQGLRVLRSWNEEVEESLDGVVLRVLAELRNSGE